VEILTLIPGTPEWHAHRAKHRNASDAPAMMGVSPYKTRTELLREVATGISPEVDPETQRRFDNGHLFEGLARPLGEKIIGTELAPLVGVSGRDSASYDGLPMMEDIPWEHKTLNQALREAMVDGCTGADLPMLYQIQMEHQCMVGADTIERVLFMASRWEIDPNTGEYVCMEERHCWYTPNLELRGRIKAGWEQFDADVAAWTPEPAAPPPAVAQVIEALPALVVRVEGRVVSSNLDVYRKIAEERIASVKTELKTDQDFVDADATARHFKDGAAALKLAKQQAQAQAESIDAVFRTIDQIVEMMDTKRIALEKLVTSEKERRKLEIVTNGQKDLREHIDALAKRVGRPMPAIEADFAGAVKNKRLLDNMRDAVSVVVANAKASATLTAARMEANLATIRNLAGGYTGMFPDEAVLLLKAPEDCEALVQARVDKRKAEDQAKLEAERERIAAEERAKAEAAARAEVERQAAERRQREEDEAEARRAEQAKKTYPNGAPMFSNQVKENGDRVMLDTKGNRSIFCDVDEGCDPPAPRARSDAKITIGELNGKLQHLSVNAAGLAALGFAAQRERGACLYFADDLDPILAAMVEHIESVREQLRQPAGALF